jgi:hypothetical protein
MTTIRIHRHPDCARCARIARVHRALDWLGRVETTTETPRSGPLRLGEVVVEDRRTGVAHGGAEAFRLMCRAIPLYVPALPLLRFAAFRRYIEAELGGCADGACEVPARGDGRASRAG